MGGEILVQGGLFLLAAIIFLSLQSIPKRCLSHLRRRSSSSPQSQSRRHFFAGAHFFARATASNSSNPKPNPKSSSLLKSAIAEADAAIALDPRDAAPHILRALALRRLGRLQQAIKSLDAALSLPQSKTLTTKERADALVQRAELHLEINRKRRAEQALADILKAIEIRNKDKDDGGKPYCVLGECYEVMGRREEAERAYRDALEKDDSLEKAIEGLKRMQQSAAASAAAAAAAAE